jgi:putative flavoprotein involved in K+ transport
MRPVSERLEVVVVGGGQAGLAMGHHLAGQGRRFIILEAAAEPAAAWRGRWDSLRLFTPARYSALPGRPFPGDPDAYPARDEVVAYLAGYARDLPVELASPVRAVRRTRDGYRVELDDRALQADQVVLATGPFQVPRTPAFAQRLDPRVAQVHASAYRAPGDLPEGPVLVVGGGNTGFQIAEELARTREVHLAIGSRQTPLPQRVLGRDVFRLLDATGALRIAASSRLGRRLRERETLIGSSPRAARRRHGIVLRARATEAEGACVAFADGTRLAPRAVVWATGYGVDHGIVRVPVLDEAGRLVHRRGVTASPGLYALGLPWLHTRGSALLGWVGDDAAFLAERIAARAAGTVAGRARRPAAAAPR